MFFTKFHLDYPIQVLLRRRFHFPPNTKGWRRGRAAPWSARNVHVVRALCTVCAAVCKNVAGFVHCVCTPLYLVHSCVLRAQL